MKKIHIIYEYEKTDIEKELNGTIENMKDEGYNLSAINSMQGYRLGNLQFNPKYIMVFEPIEKELSHTPEYDPDSIELGIIAHNVMGQKKPNTERQLRTYIPNKKANNLK